MLARHLFTPIIYSLCYILYNILYNIMLYYLHIQCMLYLECKALWIINRFLALCSISLRVCLDHFKNTPDGLTEVLPWILLFWWDFSCWTRFPEASLFFWGTLFHFSFHLCLFESVILKHSVGLVMLLFPQAIWRFLEWTVLFSHVFHISL